MNRQPLPQSLADMKVTVQRYGCAMRAAKYIVIDNNQSVLAAATNEFHAYILRRAFLNSGHVGCIVVAYK